MFENIVLKLKTEVEKIHYETTELLNKTENKNQDFIDILKSDKIKLNNFEFVISVVGTLKAGKSTTINAIIGQDLLPHRNEAMTALPTLVTHKKDKNIPTLYLKKVDFLNKKLDEVKSKLNQNKDNSSEYDETILKDKKFKFEEKFIGNENIKKCLTILNDLMRVSKNLEVGSIYKEFMNIDELPRIEVEFEYLKNLETDYKSDITLLDTPGPNEYKHAGDLKEIFKKQIVNSSAIILVVDYTNKSSEATQEIKDEIEAIKDIIKPENIFILVNKFDQRNDDDPDYEKTKENLFKNLDSNNILRENIYPIASINAYYVTLARKELNTKGKLDENISWVKTFGKKNIGRDWENIIKDKKKVEEICTDVWGESFFQKPIENIIQKGFENSAFKILLSAIHRLNYLDKEILTLFNVRQSSIEDKKNGNINTLKEKIISIQEDIKKIKEVEDYFKNKDYRNEYKVMFDSDKQKITRELKEKLESYEYNLKFEYKSDAENKKVEIINNLEKEKKETFNEFNQIRIKNCVEYIKVLNNDLEKELKEIIENVKKKFNFELKIDIPYLSLSNGNIVEISSDYIKVETKDKNELYYKLLRKIDFLDKEWGKESTITKEDIEKANKKVEEDIEKFIENSINSDFQSIERAIMLSIANLKLSIMNFESEMSNIEKKSQDANFDYEKELASVKEDIYWIHELLKRIEIAQKELRKSESKYE
ncbi:dynamin family protein [Aliarcobacter skirrowii]|uniref:dynamin family protein n=1 Tax=Aliarcobacter skirrowii TaxID=28200 RepID=UPI0029A9570E|nr:dynamin family protein [Aliarcobacter skirrowii]MDX4066066.1 dynamin family protein [Aliarcobacter skirrowii]